jgi:four helix bundle protein
MAKKNTYVRRVTDLLVYQMARKHAMEIFRFSKQFPVEERWSLTNQIRKSSRSVNANLSEAWAKRIYKAALVSKLNDAEGEARETQTWLEYSVLCEYLDRDSGATLYRVYDEIISILISMQRHPEKWLLKI